MTPTASTILAIDPGSSCGWAVGSGPDPAAAGTWNLAPRPGDSPGCRYLILVGRLNDTLRAYPGLSLIVTETAHHRGGAATRYALGYQAHVESWCATHGIEHAGVASGTLKRHATGRGNASKDAMIAAGRRNLGIDTDATDDEVDARWIYDWARAAILGEPQ